MVESAQPEDHPFRISEELAHATWIDPSTCVSEIGRPRGRRDLEHSLLLQRAEGRQRGEPQQERPAARRRDRRRAAAAWPTLTGARPSSATSWPSATSTANRPKRPRPRYGGKPEIYQDYRKLLERKDIDVIVNGTPDHWHTAVNIAACQAGKDVYAEKPLTLTIDEGKLLCKVVEETGRIVQVGTQQRSEQAVPDGRRAGPQRADRQAAAGLGRAAVLQHQGRAVRHRSRCRREARLGPLPGPGPGARRTASSGRTPISAGGTSTPAASSPTGATTTWTSPTGAWTAS